MDDRKEFGGHGRRTILVGLVGRGIQLSRTPAVHEAAGAALGLDYTYRLFDTDRMAATITLEELLRLAERDGFAGLNITFPYKLAVLDHLDELSPAAEAVGAVNTVVFEAGRRVGHNTDMWGFAESFRSSMAGAARDNVLLTGAGGGGAAVAHALVECGVRTLLIFDQDEEKAGELAGRIDARYGQGRAIAAARLTDSRADGLDGIVNATPVGMAQFPGMPVPEDFFGPGLWVADIVYFPLETELLRKARGKGCRVLPGSGMAIFQAVKSFELFTGIRPDVDRMTTVFNAFDAPVPN